MDGFNPLTIGDMPDDFIENPDGSVTVPDEEEVPQAGTDFMENLADVLKDTELSSLAREYLDLCEKDKTSRKRRDDQYAEGIRRTGLGDDAPGGAAFEGASKVVHPMLAEACVDFAASTMKELFPSDGPVKTKLYGQETDPVYMKSQRKRDFLNWQLTQQIEEYRSELEQLLTQLPLGGSQYMKLWYDGKLRRPSAEAVYIDDVLIPFAASSIYTAPRVTHVLHLTEHEFARRVKSGLYVDLTESGNPGTPETTAAAAATNKVEGKDEDAYNEDGLRDIFEIYTWLEIEKDPVAGGESAPYIMTVDVHTEKVIGLYRNWEQNDPIFKKLDWLVDFSFIKWRGAYGVGLPHLIGGIASALTGALRALLDSAHIANSPTAIKLKGGRMSGQDVTVEMTQITEIDAPPGVDDVRKVMMPMPFPGPSPVLFQLLGFLQDAGRGVVGTAEEKIAEASNQMPVGTALALIEQGSKVFSNIHARMHESQARALDILCRINRMYVTAEGLGPFANQIQPEDFADTDDVVPVSDPNIFSEAQRFAQLQGVLQMMQDPSVQWNKLVGYRRALKLMRVENPDELLPPPPQPVTADPLQENSAVQTGAILKANPQQDHMAHIQAHVACVEFGLMNPLANIQSLMGLLGHVGEHIVMLENVTAMQMTQQVMIQAQAMGQMMSPDMVAAMAQMQAQQVLVQQFAPVFQKVGQLQQALQQKMPPPPMPPEVQASIQIAQMDQDRKKALDQASMNLENQKLGIKGQADQMQLQMDQAIEAANQQRETMRFQLEQADMQFQQRLDMMAQQSEDQAKKMSQQIELMKNDADNRQKQMTELLKNTDDNRTDIIIEKMKLMMEQSPMQGSTPAVDLAPQLEQLGRVLEQIGQSKTNDALTSVMQGLQVTMESMNRPKTRMLIKDGAGKTIGMSEE